MSGIKTAKRLLRKDVKKTLTLMTPEEKKRQSISVTEKVSEILGKIWTVLTH
jgi:5-formyltetrahydrofolate cyclo-ligase